MSLTAAELSRYFLLEVLVILSLPIILAILNIYLSKRSTYYQKHKSNFRTVSILIALAWVVVIYMSSLMITPYNPDVRDTSKLQRDTSLCMACLVKDTKGNNNPSDDVFYGLPYYCEDKDLTEYCCRDVAHTECKKISDCDIDGDSPVSPTYRCIP